MRRIVLGMLAHVDAGKTTLSEALLYASGAIRRQGRVDHGDAFLDTDAIERRRGITIFAKQALFETGDLAVTLLDTPGHTDFSAEAERALQVLDCAVLIISGTDGVQAHTETLWRLLRRHRIPTFLFVNKTDLPGCEPAARMKELQERLSPACVDFTANRTDDERAEAAAERDETLLELWSETGGLTDREIADAVAGRRLFPCCFGSALKLDGVREFLDVLARYAPAPIYPQEFAARVFKIARDPQGNRLTYFKVLGGSLAVRAPVTYRPRGEKDALTEKISQLRLYSGAKFTPVQTAEAGGVYAAAGLTATYPGQGLGAAQKARAPLLEPVMSYRLVVPDDCDVRALLPKLRQNLEEENPQLHLLWDEALREIRVQLMGPVETEVFCRLVEERCGVPVSVDAGRILYRETIAESVTGVGHFEPLRHYAEVVLRLDPIERGSGVVFASECGEETLAYGWQRVVLNCLAQKEHRGVLTGAPLTDVRITLLAGRAHPKHTEGGDFRQAALRAVRQALMKAKSILLEPMASLDLAVPPERIGHAIGDLHAMGAAFSPAEEENGQMRLRGRAPLAALRIYAADLAAYTHGQGRLVWEPDGYDVCRDQEKLVLDSGYDPARDLDNPADSVFCSHGAGTVVPWNEVEKQMHLVLSGGRSEHGGAYAVRPGPLDIGDAELQAIFAREFGPERRPFPQPPKAAYGEEPRAAAPPKKHYLIVDGYNVLFAWDELRALARDDFDAARGRLIHLLGSYAAYRKCETVVVFDAYRVAGHRGERFDSGGVHVVYTSENETGDLFIEKLVREIGRSDTVRVVTSDALIQLSALRSGVLRVSAREFAADVAQIEALIREEIETLRQKNRIAGKTTIRLPQTD